MKSYLSLLGLVFATHMAHAAVPTEEITAPVDRIFIPEGFDDNDNVEVVIYGNFPDTCYTVGRASAKVDTEARKVTVSATSFHSLGKTCIQTITPFIQSISLGMIPSGAYEVVYDANKEVSRALAVSKRTTESADDFLYASVENAHLNVDPATGKQSLQLWGHFPHFFVGCMVINEVRNKLAPADVLVVQPIAQIVDDESCADQPSDRSFSVTVGLKEPFKGEGLLHVRTLNGTSLNRFIDMN